ncbi:MAG: ABC transporter ATP-binding protein [Ruminiclostridium sp.]|nr:ABC transporter ATP-binding protein [Ruminiclostridium sp.]
MFLDNIIISIVSEICCILGLWMIFKKFGRKPWYSLIPFVRFYWLSECVGKQKEGAAFMLYQTLLRFVEILGALMPDDQYDLTILLSLIEIFLCIPNLIYMIRVCGGLCEAFNKRKYWIVVWLLADPICYLIFGFNKNFRPREELVDNGNDKGADLSGIVATGDGSNLSVNITRRSVINSFHKFTLLRDIHLSVPTGHMVLLLGGSGAGKTTFLNAVTGYEKAEADIELGKFNVYKDYDSMKYDIGFVPQQDLMRSNDTVYRTIADAASLRLPSSIRGKERKKRIDDVLEVFGLTAVKKSLVSKLSGGQRKRLSIAMEYISYPTLFILDEPDSGLDGVVARNLFERLRGIADTNKIVMVITHTPDRVIDLFDDVIVLAKDAERTGRLAYYGPVEKAYEFFGKNSMEDILLSINQKEEGGEGKADEFVTKYASFALAGGNA